VRRKNSLLLALVMCALSCAACCAAHREIRPSPQCQIRQPPIELDVVDTDCADYEYCLDTENAKKLARNLMEMRRWIGEVTSGCGVHVEEHGAAP